MCMVSPNCSGIVIDVVFWLDFGIVDVVPMSTMGLWSEVEMEKLFILVDLISLTILVTFLKPNLRRNGSIVKETSFGREDTGMS